MGPFYDGAIVKVLVVLSFGTCGKEATGSKDLAARLRRLRFQQTSFRSAWLSKTCRSRVSAGCPNSLTWGMYTDI